MSTRCNIHFNHETSIRANIYRHSDGYPGKIVRGEMKEFGVLSDLLEFFQEVKANVGDTRFGCPQYLSAKYVVWQAKQNAKTYKGINPETKELEFEDSHYLDFLGVAPAMQDHGDIEYVYEVDCSQHDKSGFPSVRWRAVPWEGDPGPWKTVYLTGKPRKAKTTVVNVRFPSGA